MFSLTKDKQKTTQTLVSVKDLCLNTITQGKTTECGTGCLFRQYVRKSKLKHIFGGWVCRKLFKIARGNKNPRLYV